MGTVIVTMQRIVCHDTTEVGHDEVYYLSPVITRIHDGLKSLDPALAPGPGSAQGGDADGPGGTHNTAWDCNDSGDLADQTLNVDLFPVQVDPNDHVQVTLSFWESDGDNLADVEARYAALANGAMSVLTAAIPAVAVVTVPLTIAVDVVTEIVELAHGFLDDDDDPLGTVSLVLEGDGETVRLTQVGVGDGQLVDTAADGEPGRAVAHLTGSGADYTIFLGLGGTTAQKAQGITVQAPLTQDLTAADLVSWSTADANGAAGSLHGEQVTLTGPMGTAFYLHDDYPNFNRTPFTPRLPTTGMVELRSAPGHTFTVTFPSPVQDPILMLGSLGSVLSLPAGTVVTRVSGDQGLDVAGNVVKGDPVTPLDPGGPTDSNGTVRLAGIFGEISFSLEPNGDFPEDGVFLQVGGTAPA